MSAAMYIHTSSATIAAAAEQARRRLWQEEEELTPYSERDLSEDWEFKIVRSGTAAFRKPEEFAKLLEQEARFGWVLLEKLDDGRVRFKRRVGSGPRLSLGEHEGDPYRSVYGMVQSRQAAIVVLVAIAVSVGIMFLVVLMMR